MNTLAKYSTNDRYRPKADIAADMRRALTLSVIAMAVTTPADAVEKPIYVAQLSCSNGPHSIKLPKSYRSIRTLAPIQSEEVVRTDSWNTYKTQTRLLRFPGLELVVITFSNSPDRYLLSSAKLRSSTWKVTEKLRVGNSAEDALGGLPVDSVPRDGGIFVAGDTDSIRITLSQGQVKEVTYECYTG